MEYWYINRRKMRVLDVCESFKSYEPKVQVGPIQGRLNGLQYKGKVG